MFTLLSISIIVLIAFVTGFFVGGKWKARAIAKLAAVEASAKAYATALKTKADVASAAARARADAIGKHL